MCACICVCSCGSVVFLFVCVRLGYGSHVLTANLNCVPGTLLSQSHLTWWQLQVENLLNRQGERGEGERRGGEGEIGSEEEGEGRRRGM